MTGVVQGVTLFYQKTQQSRHKENLLQEGVAVVVEGVIKCSTRKIRLQKRHCKWRYRTLLLPYIDIKYLHPMPMPVDGDTREV